jgi:hypothetical protein
MACQKCGQPTATYLSCKTVALLHAVVRAQPYDIISWGTICVTALERSITMEGEAHRNMCCIHENTKLKKEEGKEAAKGVVHSVISRERINLGCTT